MTPEENIKKLNIVLPKAPDPVGSYVASKIVGNLIFISGQVSFNSNGILTKGKIGKDLQITAKSSDGIIEGIEVSNGWNAIGVQWHPENMLEDNVSIKLFEWLNS